MIGTESEEGQVYRYSKRTKKPVEGSVRLRRNHTSSQKKGLVRLSPAVSFYSKPGDRRNPEQEVLDSEISTIRFESIRHVDLCHRAYNEGMYGLSGWSRGPTKSATMRWKLGGRRSRSRLSLEEEATRPIQGFCGSRSLRLIVGPSGALLQAVLRDEGDRIRTQGLVDKWRVGGGSFFHNASFFPKSR